MKGILFTPDNIKAIRDNLKTQTRRLDHLKEINQEPDRWHKVWNDMNELSRQVYIFQRNDEQHRIIKPLYRVGDIVYIKEAYSHYGNTANVGLWVAGVKYRLDSEVRQIPFNDHQPPVERWWNTGKPITYYQSPLFMPSWAARDFAKVTDVRPEKLQDITEEDAKAEGVETCPNQAYTDYRHHFMALWDSINKKYPFDGNYWVWRICFHREGERNDG